MSLGRAFDGVVIIEGNLIVRGSSTWGPGPNGKISADEEIHVAVLCGGEQLASAKVIDASKETWDAKIPLADPDPDNRPNHAPFTVDQRVVLVGVARNHGSTVNPDPYFWTEGLDVELRAQAPVQEK